MTQTNRLSPRGRYVDIVLPLTVTAAAYSSGDCVGGLLSITNVGDAALNSGFTAGKIVGVTLMDEAKQDVDYDLVLFDSNPSATTFTDKSALDVADADLAKILGFTNIDTPSLFADNAVLRGELDQPIPFILTGTTLYATLVARGTPTFAAVTDVQLRLTIERENA